MSTPPGGDELTVQASPGLVFAAAPGQPGPRAVATLTIVPRFVAHTQDAHPGADPVDVILSSLLARGFHTLVRYAHRDVVGLPVLPGWVVRLGPAGDTVSVEGSGQILYSGDLGARVPDGWRDTVARARRLAVLVASGIDLERHDRTAQIDTAARVAAVVAAMMTAAGA